MLNENEILTNEEQCSAGAKRFAGNLFLLILGGGIGAAVALLLAPKPGRELREDIAETAASRYNDAVEAGKALRETAGEYMAAAKDTGTQVLDVASSRLGAVKDELSEDAEKIGQILEEGVERVSGRKAAAS
jgi:gas vesicle protein